MKFIIGIDVAKDKFDCLWLKDIIALTAKTKVLPNCIFCPNVNTDSGKMNIYSGQRPKVFTINQSGCSR